MRAEWAADISFPHTTAGLQGQHKNESNLVVLGVSIITKGTANTAAYPYDYEAYPLDNNRLTSGIGSDRGRLAQNGVIQVQNLCSTCSKLFRLQHIIITFY